MLWTDTITPLELTTLARMSAEERERTKGSLAEFLPNRHVNDLTVRLSAGENGLVEAAEYRAFDAETPIGATPGGKRIVVELPPLGQKVRVSEYDQLRQRGTAASSDVIRNSIGQVTIRTAQAVADRMELMRGEVLATGKATLNENQLIAEQDYGRDDDMTVTAAVKWGEAATAKPIDDLVAWAEAYTSRNGEEPGAVLMSKTAFSALMRVDEFRKLATGPVPSMVTSQFVRDSLAAFGLPEIRLYDRRVRVGGEARRVLPEDVALLLPTADSDLGATFWGTTLEATDPDYGIAEDDRPGIAVGAYKANDPMGVWVRAAAIGMPVLADANLAMAATVL